MPNFKEWLVTEAAIGPQNIQYDPQGRPNFRVSIRDHGQIIGLEVLQGGAYKYAGDLSSEVFGDTSLLEGHKLFNWHSDLPEGGGYGPMFYDIALEIATKNGGYLASATLINRLMNVQGAKENKGHAGGDASDAAEGIYKFYYERRRDVESVMPNLILMNEPDQGAKPWMYELYHKSPTVLPKLIEMNKKGKPALVSGFGVQAQPIADMNFNVSQERPQQQSLPTQPQQQQVQSASGQPQQTQNQPKFTNGNAADVRRLSARS